MAPLIFGIICLPHSFLYTCHHSPAFPIHMICFSIEDCMSPSYFSRCYLFNNKFAFYSPERVGSARPDWYCINRVWGVSEGGILTLCMFFFYLVSWNLRVDWVINLYIFVMPHRLLCVIEEAPDPLLPLWVASNSLWCCYIWLLTDALGFCQDQGTFELRMGPVVWRTKWGRRLHMLYTLIQDSKM